VGGTLDAEGRPVYANARYYIWKDEWEFWTAEAARGARPWLRIWDVRRQVS
jgi:hypothetical protein